MHRAEPSISIFFIKMFVPTNLSFSLELKLAMVHSHRLRQTETETYDLVQSVPSIAIPTLSTQSFLFSFFHKVHVDTVLEGKMQLTQPYAG